MVLVSTIIPVYDQERYVASAIDSALAQTFRDMEILAVDDGSTDRTPGILATYGNRIRVLRKPNGGVATALNEGIRHARGDWIAWLSSDDLWEPTKLERQVAAAEREPRPGLVYSDAWIIDSEGRILRRTLPPPAVQGAKLVSALVRRCFINGASVVMRRDLFERFGFFNERDQVACDYDMWLRLALAGVRFAHVPEPLARYRIHPEQDSVRKREAVVRTGKQVASRALHRMGSARGAAAALLRLKDEVGALPWMVRPSGGASRFPDRLRAVVDSFRIYVNPDG